MAKVVLPRITSGYLSADTMNDIIALIETAFDNTLSRDGDTPNQMTADVDMNGKRIMNLPTAVNDSDPITFAQLRENASGYVNQGRESYTAVGGEGLVTLTTVQYQVGVGNLAVYVNGVRKFAGTDFTETSSTSVTFSPALVAGQKVEFVVNEYLATIDVSGPTSVSWSILTNIPAFGTRWPTWDEVSGKPATFTATAHVHSANDITSGYLADAQREVYVQAVQPTAQRVGALWFW